MSRLDCLDKTPPDDVIVVDRDWVYVETPKMKQWTTAMDGVEKLQLQETEMPTPKEGEVLVKIHAVGLNYRDIQVCDGVFKDGAANKTVSLVPCSDMCGTVVDVSRAEQTTNFGNTNSYSNSNDKNKNKHRGIVKGARVVAIFLQSHIAGDVDQDDLASGLGMPLPGVLAQYRCFPAESLVAVPEYLSDEEGSCLPLAATTAWTALNWLRPYLGRGERAGHVVGDEDEEEEEEEEASFLIQSEEKKKKTKTPTTVLLQGTAAVALAALQMAKAAGLHAVMTAPTDEHVRRARDDLAADTAINYQTHWAWEGQVLEATSGKGADVVFEPSSSSSSSWGGGGGSVRTLRKSFACVAFGGLINCIGPGGGGHDDGDGDGDGDNGTATSPPPLLPLHSLNVNKLALARNVTIRGIVNGGRDRCAEVLRFYARHGLRPVVDRTFVFEEAVEALAYANKGLPFGTVVIKVD